MKVLLRILFLLTSFGTQGWTSQCYQCQYVSTSSDNSCYGPNIDDQYLLDCPSGQDHCLTAIGKEVILGAVAISIERKCSSINVQPSCPEIFSGIQICAHYCSQDGCNNNNGNNTQVLIITDNRNGNNNINNGNSGNNNNINNGNSGSLIQASLINLMLAIVGALALIKW
ncbi:unnamed protein product [Clavelina lepadiformis]|uniref:Uncharacterized protein n=1 Tax=Clavelina lepadiformis TaxID=159417 RepID=A0ABP0FJE6_CLALP